MSPFFEWWRTTCELSNLEGLIYLLKFLLGIKIGILSKKKKERRVATTRLRNPPLCTIYILKMSLILIHWKYKIVLYY